MKLAYYPGCSLHSTAREYDQSLRLCARELGVELVEVPDWNCCGATSAHSLSEELSLLLAARTFVQARQVARVLLAPCAACYNRLVVARGRLRDEGLARELGAEVPGLVEALDVEVWSILNLLEDDGVRQRVSAGARVQLEGLRVACYYGCFLLRPGAATGRGETEDPLVLEELLAGLGAEPLSWSHKSECCGAGFSLPEPGVVVRLSGEVLRAARRAGAEAVVVACPLCQVNLDARQEEIARQQGEDPRLPVLYVTELLGLAFGLEPRALGLRRHLVDPFPVLRSRGLL